MSEKSISKALQTAVLNAVAASVAPDLKVQPEGISIVVPNDHKYLEIIQIRNNVQGDSWDSSKTYRGFLRLILHWPIKNTGVYDAQTLLENIAEFFAKGTVFTEDGLSVRITENPDMLSMLKEPPQLLFPLTIRYLCFKQSA